MYRTLFAHISVTAMTVAAFACDPDVDGDPAGEATPIASVGAPFTGPAAPNHAGLKYAFVARADVDASVLENVIDIAEGSLRSVDDKTDAAADEILIEYVGKGKLGPLDASAEDNTNEPLTDSDVGQADDAPRAFILFSPDTLNTFRIHLTEDQVPLLVAQEQGQAEMQLRASAPAYSAAGDGVASNDFTAGVRPQEGFSANQDARARIYGINASVAGVNRWMVHFSNNCWLFRVCGGYSHISS